MSAQIKATAVEKATAAWGATIPSEVMALAEYADQASASAAADRIGYSAATVSYVLSKRYAGDVGKVFEKIRGALMGEVVECPALGEIRRDQCLDHQRQPFSATSAARARVYRACRSGCPHSRLKGA